MARKARTTTKVSESSSVCRMTVGDDTVMTADNLQRHDAIPASLDDVRTMHDLYEFYRGKFVLVRSRNEMVNAGIVVLMDESGIVLKNAIRLWFYRPADQSVSWYEGVANVGLHPDSKVAPAVAMKVIVEDYAVVLCTEEARFSIEGFKPHPQS